MPGAKQRSPPMLDRLLLLAESFYRAGRPADAAAACRQALALAPDDLHTLGLLAGLSLEAGDAQGAERAYRHMAALLPGDPAGYAGLGGVLLDTGRPGAAAGAYGHALRLAPEGADTAFNRALALRLAGRTEDALAAYRRILELRPDYHEAAFNLGNLLLLLGRPEEAATALRQALTARPGHEGALFNLAQALGRTGRNAEAAAALRGAVASSPAEPAALLALSRETALAGRLEEALAWACRAAGLAPGLAEARTHHAKLVLLAGRMEAAGEEFLLAVTLDPASAEAWAGLGGVRGLRRDDAGAVAAFGRAARIEPGNPDRWSTLAMALTQAKRGEAAREATRRALLLAPGSAQAWLAEGDAFRQMGDAAAAEARYRRACLAQPDRAEARYRLHLAAIGPGRFDEAAERGRQALEVDPAHAPTLVSLGNVEQDRGNVEAARTSYLRAWRAGGDAGGRVKRALALPIIPGSRDEIEHTRARFSTEIARLQDEGLRLDDPVAQVGQTCFYLAYHAQDDRPLQQQVAAFYRKACPDLLFTAPHAARPPRPARGRRLRIGFVSAHFHGHTIARLNEGLIARLDRSRFDPVLVCATKRDDAMRRRLAAAAGSVLQLPTGDLAAAREAIAAQELDLLYYTDIGMEPFTYFLAFSRLAPVQTLTWGHPDTTALPGIDWFLSCDAMEPEGAQAHYAEPLARLPGPTVWYPRPVLPQRPKRRAELGLPEGATLYVCPQSLFKLHPDFDPVLVEILRRDPRGVLVLLQGPQPAVARRLLDRLGRAGPDVAQRVRLLGTLSTPDFLTLTAVCDVMLDPLHYSGGNTSLEAFAVGTPIVTWPGAFMRGRHTCGFYRLMGYEELVARDHAHYVELAVRLGTDVAFRRRATAAILDACPVLFENDATLRALENFLADAVDQAAAKGTPAKMA
jgi:protein O-GlcNAc transferase